MSKIKLELKNFDLKVAEKKFEYNFSTQTFPILFSFSTYCVGTAVVLYKKKKIKEHCLFGLKKES